MSLSHRAEAEKEVPVLELLLFPVYIADNQWFGK